MIQILEKIVIPVCHYRIENNKARIINHYGTAFFINPEGLFLTARHVLYDNIKIGLIVKGKDLENLMVPIERMEFAPDNIDIAIGWVNYKSSSDFVYKDKEISLWQDVATYGYPEQAVSRANNRFNINTRAHKGYIQRVIRPNDEIVSLRKHKTLFELNFPITKGLSGAPLFVGGECALVGICIGSHTVELVNPQELNPQREEYGLAQDIKDILEWKPEILNEKTLKDFLSANRSC